MFRFEHILTFCISQPIGEVRDSLHPFGFPNTASILLTSLPTTQIIYLRVVIVGEKEPRLLPPLEMLAEGIGDSFTQPQKLGMLLPGPCAALFSGLAATLSRIGMPSSAAPAWRSPGGQKAPGGGIQSQEPGGPEHLLDLATGFKRAQKDSVSSPWWIGMHS